MRVGAIEGGISVQVEAESETRRLGQVLASMLGPGDVVALIGPLGAGKTLLSRAIAEALGVDSRAISSPTFTLINEYQGELPFYHFDTYRLKSVEEFDDLGASDYWARADGVCLIEWADRVIDRLPDATWKVEIEPTALTERTIKIRSPKAANLVELLN